MRKQGLRPSPCRRYTQSDVPVHSRPGSPSFVRTERCAGEASSLLDAQRIQEMLAPLERTRAAKLAMARKTRFMCAPPSRYRSQPAVAASRRPEDPLRSMLRRGGDVHVAVLRVGHDRSSRPGGDLIARTTGVLLRVTSPAHRSLCSCQRARPLPRRTGPQRPTPEGHCSPCSDAHSTIPPARRLEGLGSLSEENPEPRVPRPLRRPSVAQKEQSIARSACFDGR